MLNINSVEFEKKSVFFVNTTLILLIIIFFLYKIPMVYFFYLNLVVTFGLSYLYFKKSRKLSKYLILTNMFIFFYFLYPHISSYLYALLGEESYIFILFYNIFIAYIFLLFSGEDKRLFENIKKFNFKIFGIVILLGILFGILFFYVREPVPLNSIFNPLMPNYLIKVVFFTLILAISEQMIFSGFLFNIYKELANKREAYFQVSTIFILFHMLRFESLIVSYIANFNKYYLLLILFYYILLFIFMLVALHLYNFSSKKYSGNFIYPVVLHFITDFILFYFIFLINT